MHKKLILWFSFLLTFTVTKASDDGKSTLERELTRFLEVYVEATNSHDFNNVRPLLLPDAVYWFNKSESRGLAAIEANFNATWSYLPDEVYAIEHVKWLTVAPSSASCIYDYTYSGTHAGKAVAGRGRGTTILVKRYGKWLIAHEHLSIPIES